MGAAREAAAPPADTAPPEADRAAILAMAGDYRVRFHFDETVVIESGYARREPKRSGALETVLVIEDEPGRIVLQHLLMSPAGNHVTKHWRQDWHWQASERLEFSADQTWVLRPLDPGLSRGAWTQCVYEVSDAPRYCGTGPWNHRYGVATWTSDRTWRPLPRREYTTREDYNALNVENRHTIVPGGWSHEQDNSKVVREVDGASRTLVREFGFNDYQRVDDVDFGPARDWWRRTAGYWSQVRAGWERRIRAGGGIRLDTAVDGMPIIEATFAQASRAAAGEAVAQADLDAIFARWTSAPDAPPRDGDALAGR
ncbi:MAG: hypothetical protein KF823_08155 [Xanthomonadales bacterium]|nr:hypothetical protein [Xanthomonadales bacterium]